jgi:hypothetical protein
VLAFTFDHYGKPEATFELASQGRNVVLILTHRGTNGDPAITLGFAYGWHVHLTHLIARLDGSPRPPFWPAMQRFKTEYAQLLRA